MTDEAPMSKDGVAGVVSELWRFPVKSMAGERLEAADVTAQGVLGDRAYGLIDAQTGKVVSAKSVRLFPNLLACRAAFVQPPQTGRELPAVRITLPSGQIVTSDDNDADRLLSAHFGRDVRLARAAPDDFTIDQYHPDVVNVDPAGHRNTVVEQKLGSAFFSQAGMDSPLAVGSFMDLFPVSVITTSTLKRLAELQPKSRFDTRRFRMNLVVETTKAGFIENEWVESQIQFGSHARLVIALPDPRCVMTTLAQDDLPKDTEVIRTLTLHNRLPIAGAGKFPCAGVYAVVITPGTVSQGDIVATAGSSAA
jgi:uncharacterized protein YcbX